MRPAVAVVEAFIALDDIIAFVTQKGIIALPTHQQIIVLFAGEGIITRETQHNQNGNEPVA